jgi:hypothetical protein
MHGPRATESFVQWAEQLIYCSYFLPTDEHEQMLYLPMETLSEAAFHAYLAEVYRRLHALHGDPPPVTFAVTCSD